MSWWFITWIWRRKKRRRKEGRLPFSILPYIYFACLFLLSTTSFSSFPSSLHAFNIICIWRGKEREEEEGGRMDGGRRVTFWPFCACLVKMGVRALHVFDTCSSLLLCVCMYLTRISAHFCIQEEGSVPVRCTQSINLSLSLLSPCLLFSLGGRQRHVTGTALPHLHTVACLFLMPASSPTYLSQHWAWLGGGEEAHGMAWLCLGLGEPGRQAWAGLPACLPELGLEQTRPLACHTSSLGGMMSIRRPQMILGFSRGSHATTCTHHHLSPSLSLSLFPYHKTWHCIAFTA